MHEPCHRLFLSTDDHDIMLPSSVSFLVIYFSLLSRVNQPLSAAAYPPKVHAGCLFDHELVVVPGYLLY